MLYLVAQTCNVCVRVCERQKSSFHLSVLAFHQHYREFHAGSIFEAFQTSVPHPSHETDSFFSAPQHVFASGRTAEDRGVTKVEDGMS